MSYPSAFSPSLPTLPRGDSLLALELALFARAVAHGQVNPRHALLERNLIDKASQILSRGEPRASRAVERAFAELAPAESRPRWVLHRVLRAAAARIRAPGLVLARGVTWAIPFEARVQGSASSESRRPSPGRLSVDARKSIGTALASAGLIEPSSRPCVAANLLWASEGTCPSLAQVAAAGQALWAARAKQVGLKAPADSAPAASPVSVEGGAGQLVSEPLQGWVWGVAGCQELDFARWASLDTTSSQLAAAQGDAGAPALLCWAGASFESWARAAADRRSALEEAIGQAVFAGGAQVEVLDLPRPWPDAMESGVRVFRRAALREAVSRLARQSPEGPPPSAVLHAELDVPPRDFEGFAARVTREDGMTALILWPLQGDEAPEQALAELNTGLAYCGVTPVGLLT